MLHPGRDHALLGGRQRERLRLATDPHVDLVAVLANQGDGVGVQPARLTQLDEGHQDRPCPRARICTLGWPTLRYASTSGCSALYAAIPFVSHVMRGAMMLAWRWVPTAL